MALTYELQTPQLEGHKPVSNLNNVYESIQLVWSQDEEISTDHSTPATEEYVTTEVTLQRPC